MNPISVFSISRIFRFKFNDSQSTHAQRPRAETYVAKINVMIYHGTVLDKGF